MNMKMHSLLTTLLIFSAGLISPLMQTDIADSTPEASGSSSHFSLHAVNDTDNNYFEDVVVLPGESIELEVTVANWNDDPIDLRIYPSNARNSINGGFLAGTIDEELVGSAAWLDIEARELTLEATEQQTLSLTVTVPETTEPGQYISALVVDTAEAMPIPGQDVIDHRIRYAISVGILVPGEIIPSFELGEPMLIEQNLEIPITNTGNYLVRPSGELEMRDSAGEVILSAPIQLGSIYAGNSTRISLGLPVQLPDDEYSLSLRLTDPESESNASLENVAVTLSESEVVTTEPAVSIVTAAVTPNDADITYVDVELVLLNEDQQLPVNVVLKVYRDGELIEDVALASNQIFLVGENTYTSRYLPADMWEPGTYTFSVIVHAVDPETNQEMVMLEEELDAEIVVP